MDDSSMRNLQKTNQNAYPKLLQELPGSGAGDSLSVWAEFYFRYEVTTSVRSQKEQRRDMTLFLSFMERAAGSLQRTAWTPRLSRALLEALRSELHPDGRRHYSDRTINRVMAHLKTF